MDLTSQTTRNLGGSHGTDSKKSDKSDSKSSKRKAPAPPTKPNKLKPQFPTQNHPDPIKSYPGSSSSGSWSGSSSGFSPSSDSFTSSSLSVGTGNGVDDITIRNVSENDISKVLKLSEKSTENKNIKTKAQNRTSKESLSNGNENTNLSDSTNIEFDDKDHSNLSGYVENALIASSINRSDSPNRSSKSHLPPRLLSFESSSTIDLDGLSTQGELAKPKSLATEVRLDYVSLDYVKSAAAEGRHRRKDKDDDENTLRSTSSLSSSFISSIDSDDGSTIGSDVVENLYNRITAATAKHKPQSKSVSSGDIQSDLYPRIFPGHRSKSEEILSEKPELQLAVDERTSTEKVNEFLQRNFNGNNNNALSASDKKSRDIDPFDVIHNGKQGIKKCSACFGVTEMPGENMSKAMTKAIDFLGKCICSTTDNDPPENITDIDFCNSNLKEVPHDVWQHSATLIRLLLESNTIAELPRDMFTCQALEYLSVSDNDITTIPSTLASLINLKHLDISKNVIEDVPECIRCCKNLEVLDASVNPIERLSEGFTQLMSLRELYMNDCFFDFLPANFGRMSQLKVLELRDNQLQILPKSMRRLVQLNRLDLGGNAFQEWPDVISKLLELRELWLDCNELNKIPLDIGDLTHLTYLDLSRNFLESIPSQVGQLDCLTDLLLAENSLTELPDTIGFLRNLTILNLEFNQLTHIPDSIGKLVCLQELELSHNKIPSLPTTIGNLKCLEALLLDENEIQKIPNEIGKCLELKILQLSRNEITELPESLGNLSNLKVLNICQNHISNLPISMVKLAGLDALWISPNQSKPNVPLQAEIDTNTGKRVLTNILFPQNDKGAKRSTKSLSILDDDDESYANDAADDADMEAVLNKVRGKTHVVFNLDAITYSDSVEFMDIGQEEDSGEESTEKANDTVNELLNYGNENEEKMDVYSKEDPIFKKASKPKHDPDNFSVHVSDAVIPPSGLSVFSTNSNDQTKTNFDNSRPQLKTANILKVKQNIEPEKAKESIDQKCEITDQKPSNKSSDSLESNLSQSETSNSLEDLQENDNIIPPRAGEIKAWTSSSNIPLDLSETVRPIDIGEPVITEPEVKNKTIVLEDKNKSKSRPVQLKHSASDKKQSNSSTAFSNADKLLDQLDQMRKPEIVPSKVIPTKPKAAEYKMDESSLLSSQHGKFKDTKRNENNPVFGFENIPFMDSDDESSVAGKGQKLNENLHLEDAETVFKPSSKIVETDTFALSPNFGMEGKSSSVTSGESLPATDHDSGVGNDVESQESIPDESNNIVVKSQPKTVVVTSQNFDLKSTRYVDSSAIRRNNKGWLGVVTTEKSEGVLPEPKLSSQKDSLKTTSPSNKETRKKDKPNYQVKPHYLDSTTVTYSHDYNQAKALKNQNNHNPNKVSQNIKKFEKFFENDMLAPKNDFQVADSNYRSLPRPLKESINAESNITSMSPKSNTSTVVVSPYKSSDNIYNSTSEVPYSLTENEITFGNSGSDITFQIKPRQPSSQPLNDTQPEQKQHAVVVRRNSGRKSKFEEALAATKHKHFRDKLEKMMNDKSPTHVSSRRNSRSNLQNIPRITSPVPRALSPHGNSTPLEQLTAEDTYYDPNIGVSSAQIPRSLSFNNKLREKLNVPTSNVSVHTHGNPRVRNGPSKINTNPFGRRGSSQRSSIRSASGYEEDKGKDLSEPENKKSLEEQLGQLLLDSSTQEDNATPKGFVPYMNSDFIKPNKAMMSPPPVNRTSDVFGGQKKTIPADWKHQLLRHLEKKRQEKDELNYITGNKTLPNHTDGRCNNKNQEFRRNDNARRSLGQESIRTRSNNMERSITAPQIGLRPEPTSNFVRNSNTGQPKVGGKRSSGRYMRTRTPGPDMDRQPKQVDQIVRPKSAMDLPTTMPNVLSLGQNRYSDWDVNKAPPETTMKKTEFSPPSYEDHILRRNTTNNDKYNDYVNIENINKMRAPKQYQDKRLIEPNNENYHQSNYPLRQTGSHESILNSKPEKIYQGTNYQSPLQQSPAIRPSNSHDSMLDSNPNPYHSNRYKQSHYGYPQYQDPNQGYYEPTTRINTNYGVIPPPVKRAPKIPPREKPTSKHRAPHQRDNYAMFPPPPMGFNDAYEGIPPLSPSLQRNYNDKEDESVASAFRPYHQQQQQPLHNLDNHNRQQKTRYDHANEQHYQPRNVIDHHRYHHHLDRGLSHQGRKSYNRRSEDYMPRNGHFNMMDDDLSAESDPSLSGELQRHWREAEAGIELVTVTVRKNPTFGFHIMGGIDAGGNPYRPDDDGVFITYVAPNGAADGYVEPGDKILLVNGSDFVGISHKRAVDLLRNAGLVAVLVVERLIGRPV